MAGLLFSDRSCCSLCDRMLLLQKRHANTDSGVHEQCFWSGHDCGHNWRHIANSQQLTDQSEFIRYSHPRVGVFYSWHYASRRAQVSAAWRIVFFNLASGVRAPKHLCHLKLEQYFMGNTRDRTAETN